MRLKGGLKGLCCVALREEGRRKSLHEKVAGTAGDEEDSGGLSSEPVPIPMQTSALPSSRRSPLLGESVVGVIRGWSEEGLTGKRITTRMRRTSDPRTGIVAG